MSALPDVDAPRSVALSVLERVARAAHPGPVRRNGEARVAALELDSRAVRPGTLYACVRGARVDGHSFAAEAVRRGASALLVEHRVQVQVPQLVVPSVRAALGPLAAAVAGHPAAGMVLAAVTGTNGKTTTSRLLRHALLGAGRVSGVVGTLGASVAGLDRPTALTTPEAPELHRLFAWMRDAGADSAVVEASSIALDLGRLDGLTVDVAVHTGLEEDHLDHHGTVEHYWASKALLFAPGRARAAVVVVDDAWGRRLADQVRVPVTTVGRSGAADVVVGEVTSGPDGTTVDVRDSDGHHRLRAYLVGSVNAGNLAAAFAAARCLGVPASRAVAGMATLPPLRGRSTLVRGDGHPLVIVDYAHTPGALAAAVQLARELAAADGRVHLVLGARGRRDRHKRQGLGVAARAADTVWLTNEGTHGEDPGAIVAELRVGLLGSDVAVLTVLDRGAAIAAAVEAGRPGDVVLVVGRGHETTLTDDGEPVHFDDAEVAARLVGHRPWVGG